MNNEFEITTDFKNQSSENFLLVQILLTWGVSIVVLAGIIATVICLVKLFLQ